MSDRAKVRWSRPDANLARLLLRGLREREEINKYGGNWKKVDVSRYVPVRAGVVNRFCRAALCQCTDGACGTPGRCDEWHLSSCVGCHLGARAIVSDYLDHRILDCALWNVRELVCDCTRCNLWNCRPFANHRGWLQWTTLARDRCHGWLHVSRYCNRPRVFPGPLGSSPRNGEMIWNSYK